MKKKTQKTSHAKSHRSLVVMMTILAMTISGCAKDRDDKYSDDAEENVVEISSLNGKEVELRTLNSLGSTPLLSDAVNVSANLSGTSISDQFSLVSYETSSDLFQDVPLFALPGQRYTLRYEVTNKHLVINKVAKSELVPFHERTFATKEGDNLVVPLIGYPITLYKQVRVRNSDNESTNLLDFIVVDNVAKATHMRVNTLSRVTFDAIKKHNVLPVNLFIDEDKNQVKEWFYASTIVGAPPEFANAIGRDVTQDFSTSSVSRVKFVKTKNALMAVNLNIDKDIDLTNENNFQIAIQIPVEWLDYRRQQEGENKLLEEEVLDNKNIESKVFQDRKYLKANFTKVTTASSGGFNDSFANDYLLDDLEITDGYVSFVTHNKATGIKTRYSFRQAHSPKYAESKQYFKTDRDIFGYFETRRNVLNNHKQVRESDREKNVLINRFMPTVDAQGKKEIIYHFSKLTNQSMRNVGRLAIDVWNKAFQAAGTGVTIRLDETRPVNLGDIRFNIINVVDTKNGGNLLGYGPTIADSETGEIISGTANIYADPFRESLYRDIRNYIRGRRGRFSPNYMLTARPPVSPLGGSDLDNVLEYAQNLYKDVDDNDTLLTNHVLIKELSAISAAQKAYKTEEERLAKMKGHMNVSEFLVEVQKSQKNLMSVHNLTEKDISGFNSKGVAHHSAFENASKDIIEEIEGRCKEELDAYITELEKDNVYYNDRDEEVIEACINKKSDTKSLTINRETISLLESRVLSTLVHEMGHNFSLRHNFIGSTDTQNFTKEDGKVVAQSSSVMDYNRGNVYELLAPGIYDIEAIRFAYASAVKTKSGEIITGLIKTKSLTDQLKEKNKERFPLKFCTDHHRSFTVGSPWERQIDPLCAMHDHGDTPLKIVQENIDSINSFRAVHGYRYDKAGSRSGIGQGLSLFRRNFTSLKKIYSQWRYHLSTFVGQENQYLENYSEEKLQEVLTSMKADKGVHGKNYAEYYEAAELAYSFLRDLAFTPAKYCIIEGESLSQKVDLLEFETLQDQMFRDKKLTIQDCKGEDVQKWVTENVGLDVKVVDSVGEYANDIKANLDPTHADFEKNNIAGFELTRRLAFVTLTTLNHAM